MLKNFWYGVEFSHAVTTTPRKLKVLGQELVLWRSGDGRVAAASNVCVHRGGSLGDGWTNGSCVVCPYHGWEFDTTGRCTKIPANRDGAQIPKKAHVDAYPAEDRYGLVWVFLGDLPEAERPPIPSFPEYGQEGWRTIMGEFSWEANYARVVENGLDFAHGPFVHSGSFGYRDEPEIPDYDVIPGDWGGTAHTQLPATPPKGVWRFLRKADQPKVRVDLEFQMPSINRIHLHLARDWQIIIFDSNVPVDGHHTRSLYVSLRNFFTGSWADSNARQRVLKVFNEDQRTVENQNPELVPFDLSAELSVRSDQLPLAYRKMRRRFLEQGWGIDSDRVESLEPNKAVVIPSPARRDNPELAKAWVFPEVPTLTPVATPDAAQVDQPVGRGPDAEGDAVAEGSGERAQAADAGAADAQAG